MQLNQNVKRSATADRPLNRATIGDWRGQTFRVLFTEFTSANEYVDYAVRHNNNKNLCGRDGRAICGPQRVPKSTCVSL